MKGGIKQKLIIVYLVAILPLTALIGYGYLAYYKHSREDAVDENYHLAKLAANSFDRYAAETIENNRSVGSAIYGNRLNLGAANDFLAAIQPSAPSTQMFYADGRGIVTASTLPAFINYDVKTLPEYTKLASGARDWAITDFRKGPNGEYGYTVLTAVRSGGQLVAVSGSTIEGRDLQQIFPRELLKGTIILTDARGEVVFNSATPNMGLSERDWSGFGPVKTALKNTGYAGASLILPGTDGEFTGSFVPVGMVGWSAGYLTPSSEAFAQVRTAALLSLLGVLTVIGLSVALALVNAKRISRPIVELSNQSVEIGKGNFQNVEIKTGDELEMLANNFNRMQKRLRGSFDDLNRLIEASKSVNTALDQKAVADSAVAYLKEILDANNVIIRLLDEETGKYSLIHTDGLEKAEAETVVRASDAFLGATADDTQAVSFYNLVDIGVKSEAFDRVGAKALLSLPLVSGNRLIGRIDALLAEATSSKLSRAEMGLAVSFAQHLSVAIENAKLLARERYIADVLQNSLLTAPQKIPGLDVGLAYHPATAGTKVGGDFYDFISFDDGRVAIVLGDISGKGIEAARHTALAKNAIRSFAFEDPSPTGVIERANRLLCNETESFSFITLFYALFDGETGDVKYASAGHPPALRFDRRADRVNELVSSGIPLGISTEAVFEERSFHLADGDKLLLYTDGLIEARHDHEMLGYRGVIEAFTDLSRKDASELAPDIVELAREFAGGELLDDVAVIAIERKAA